MWIQIKLTGVTLVYLENSVANTEFSGYVFVDDRAQTGNG
jgi:hypothetical protein